MIPLTIIPTDPQGQILPPISMTLHSTDLEVLVPKESILLHSVELEGQFTDHFDTHKSIG